MSKNSSKQVSEEYTQKRADAEKPKEQPRGSREDWERAVQSPAKPGSVSPEEVERAVRIVTRRQERILKKLR